MPNRVVAMAQPNLLFIDTNIWLDFYRARNETGLQLLGRVEKIADKLVITYQLEIEFKKNRQSAIYEGMKQLREPSQIPSPGIFSDATATRVMARNLKEAGKRAKRLHTRLIRALEDPAQHDPVYQVCQRVFQKTDDLTLTRDNPVRRAIRRAAYRRLLHGCPPGKRGDTSYGDAFNWEWMVNCAIKQAAGLVIVSRDSDYGITIENKSYINDHLRHEFSDRVSRKRKLVLHLSLSEALKSFDVPVSKQEEEAEKDLVSTSASSLSNLDIIDNYVRGINVDKSSLAVMNDYLRSLDLDKKLAVGNDFLRSLNFDKNLSVMNDYLRSLNLDKTNWNAIASALASAQSSPHPKSEEDKDKGKG